MHDVSCTTFCVSQIISSNFEVGILLKIVRDAFSLPVISLVMHGLLTLSQFSLAVARQNKYRVFGNKSDIDETSRFIYQNEYGSSATVWLILCVKFVSKTITHCLYPFTLGGLQPLTFRRFSVTSSNPKLKILRSSELPSHHVEDDLEINLSTSFRSRSVFRFENTAWISEFSPCVTPR